MDQSDFPLLFARALKRAGYISNLHVVDIHKLLNGLRIKMVFEHECVVIIIL